VAFPQVVSSSSGALAGERTAHTATAPASISAGNLILGVFGLDDADANDTLALTTGGYSTLVNNLLIGTNRARAIIAYKQADGSESGATLDFTSTNNEQFAYVMLNISGWDTGTAPEISSAVFSNNPPSLNPSGWDVEDTLWIAATIIDPAWAFATAAPSGYSNFVEAHHTDGGGNAGVCCAVATRESAAASEDPGTFTVTDAGDDNTCWTLAVRPTSAPAVPGPALNLVRSPARFA
jgi:hypothetical protein